MSAAAPSDAFGHQQPIPHIIGRTREQAMLRDILNRALSGRGCFALLAGEAGIGKTTLDRWVEEQAMRQGCVVLTGGFYDLNASLPYGGWREALDPLLGSANSLPVALVAQDGGGAAVTSQGEWFLAVRGFLRTVATAQPVVVALEDLHWADAASLDLLRYLARHIAAEPMLLLATYRDELSPHEPLYQILPDLVREACAERLHLPRLLADDVRAIVASTYRLGNDELSRLTDYLQAHAEGNPFFIGEMLRTLQEHRVLSPDEDGWVLGDIEAVSVPLVVQQLVHRRVSRLESSVRDLLAIASVIGNEVSVDLWQAASGASDEALTAAIEAAQEMHLLKQSTTSPRVAFSHALVREALYAECPLIRRRHWHRQVGEAISATARADPAIVAMHFQQAGDQRAAEWLLRAGGRAYALHAPHDAIQHLSDAIESAEQHAVPVPIAAYRTRGLAHETIGDFASARRDFASARDRAVEAGDRQGAWQALIDLGGLWAARDYARAGGLFRQALDLAQHIGDPATIAQSLNRIGNWQVNADRPLEAVPCHREALDIFERIDNQRGIAETFDLLGTAFVIAGDLAEAERCLRRAVAQFRELGDLRAFSSGKALLTTVHATSRHATLVPVVQDRDAAVEEGEAAILAAREIGWRSGEVFAQSVLAMLLNSLGDFSRGLELAQASLDLAREIGHRQWIASAHFRLGYGLREALDFAGAKRHLEQSLLHARESGSALWVSYAAGYLAQTLVAMDLVEETEAVLDDVCPAGAATDTIGLRGCACARASLALRVGEPDRTLGMVDRLLESASVSKPGTVIPMVSSLRGSALVRLGRHEEAERELLAARHAAVELGMRPLLWRIDIELGTLYREQDRSDDARRAYAAAQAMIDELAAGLPHVLREGFVTRAAATFPPPLVMDATPMRGGLTAREIDVLRLVAEGLTDPQIARRLYLSPRTVHTHLRSIYAKLDVPSRAAAARVAVERQIL
ncbi:MAG: protein kinase [Thermomicrobiales bacterium]|nr:protein kinase [Thermomicrobiales bacterium]